MRGLSMEADLRICMSGEAAAGEQRPFEGVVLEADWRKLLEQQVHSAAVREY